MDVFGKAVLDFQSDNYTEDIKTTSSLNEEDILPLSYLFRDFPEMPLIEQKALEICRGSILDIGCGAGSHALYLQQQGLDVTALDNSKGAVEVCKKRGVQKTNLSDILDYEDRSYDTLLLLMNGIGLAGRLRKLPQFLHHLTTLLNPNGQILVDSSDIIYMFDEDDDGGYWIPSDIDYYGEVSFQMTYKWEKGPVFDWLYLDFDTLSDYAIKAGMNCDLIVEGPHYDYLAKLSVV